MKKPWNYNVCRSANRFHHTRNVYSRNLKNNLTVQPSNDSQNINPTNLTPRSNMVAKREKNLKEVLKNLHNEFSNMNK